MFTTDKATPPHQASEQPTNRGKSRTSLRFIFAVHAVKTMRFCRRSGTGNSILRSNRPGRNSAGSSVSARLVAMITWWVGAKTRNTRTAESI